MGSPTASSSSASGDGREALLQRTPVSRARFRSFVSPGSTASPSMWNDISSPFSSTRTSWSTRRKRTTRIRFSVKVPVLSVRISVVEPSVSTAASRFTSALRSAMRQTPLASARVATMGRPSGTVATARAIALSTMRKRSRPAATPRPATAAAIRRVIQTNRRPRRSIRRCNGTVSSSADSTKFAIRPSSVSIPVATTIPRPDPRVTAVPLCSMQCRASGAASSATAPTSLSTVLDSPVSADSSAAKRFDSTSLISAAISCPLSITTRSPGASCSARIDCVWPSRWTVAFVRLNFRRASMARVARHSMRNPMMPLIIRTARMALPSTFCPKPKASTAAANNNPAMTLLNWESRMRTTERRLIRRSVLDPNRFCRSWASVWASPVWRSTCRCEDNSFTPIAQGCSGSAEGKLSLGSAFSAVCCRAIFIRFRWPTIRKDRWRRNLQNLCQPMPEDYRAWPACGRPAGASGVAKLKAFVAVAGFSGEGCRIALARGLAVQVLCLLKIKRNRGLGAVYVRGRGHLFCAGIHFAFLAQRTCRGG